eukprot:352968-Chlamydomonas_euryale.AAC.6
MAACLAAREELFSRDLVVVQSMAKLASIDAMLAQVCKNVDFMGECEGTRKRPCCGAVRSQVGERRRRAAAAVRRCRRCRSEIFWASGVGKFFLGGGGNELG